MGSSSPSGDENNYFTSSDPHHDMLGGGCQVRVVIENMMGRMENLRTLISGFLDLVILVRWALVTMFLSWTTQGQAAASIGLMSAWSGQVRVDIEPISWNVFRYSQLRRLTGSNLLTFFLTYLLTFFLTYLLIQFFWHIFWHSFWHIFWHSFLTSFWHIFWYILLTYLLTYLPIFFLASFWHIFWHSFWQIFWHSFWHIFWHIFPHTFWHIFWHIKTKT